MPRPPQTCNNLKLQQVGTCEELLEIIEMALDAADQDVRCRFGRHDWGPRNQDRHPRSLTRSEAHCPLIHWPFVYRVCENCSVAEWGHQPK